MRFSIKIHIFNSNSHSPPNLFLFRIRKHYLEQEYIEWFFFSVLLHLIQSLRFKYRLLGIILSKIFYQHPNEARPTAHCSTPFGSCSRPRRPETEDHRGQKTFFSYVRCIMARRFLLQVWQVRRPKSKKLGRIIIHHPRALAQPQRNKNIRWFRCR